VCLKDVPNKAYRRSSQFHGPNKPLWMLYACIRVCLHACVSYLHVGLGWVGRELGSTLPL